MRTPADDPGDRRRDTGNRRPSVTPREYARIRDADYAAATAQYRDMWGVAPSPDEDRRMWDQATAHAERDTR